MYAPPSWLMPLLAPAATLYEWAVRRRNRRYDSGLARVVRADAPVISVGNITVGGAGKTPLVIDLLRQLRELGRSPAVLTRGYGSRRPQDADEVREIEETGRGVVVADPDRVRGARIAADRHRADVLVLDDGFQHRRLARDLDIVVIDPLDPWGGGRLLPAGRLREPVEGLRRAGLIVISRSNLAPASATAGIHARLRDIGVAAPVVTARVEAVAIEHAGGACDPPDFLRGRRVLAVCGLGNPASFMRLVESLGAELTGACEFPDHHRYHRADVARIARHASNGRAETVLTTGKDWVKLAPLWRAAGRADHGPRLCCLRIAARLDDAERRVDAALRAALRSPATAAPADTPRESRRA
ncbi:MAG: tetraacyldisaccharide 4'-kinase [Phycisphaerae bacterium]|nr:tetraacyldisaccharide 4'-kinase [Phycisphaerae bacterium]MCZ2399790.1 tetraacyldisaccharide 4'-kinase [Phycisphaerae bacterium]